MREQMVFGSDRLDKNQWKLSVARSAASLTEGFEEFMVNGDTLSEPIVSRAYSALDKVGLQVGTLLSACSPTCDFSRIWLTDLPEVASALPPGFPRRLLLKPFFRAEALPNSNSSLPIFDGRTIKDLLKSEFRSPHENAEHTRHFADFYMALSQSKYQKGDEVIENVTEDIAGFLYRRSQRLSKDTKNIARGSRLYTARYK